MSLGNSEDMGIPLCGAGWCAHRHHNQPQLGRCVPPLVVIRKSYGQYGPNPTPTCTHHRSGLDFSRGIPTRQTFADVWKDMANPLQMRARVTEADHRCGGSTWPVHSGTC